MSSVYVIRNTINGKLYVGKTDLTVDRRWRQHLNYSASDRHLTRALRKYGKDAFVVSEIAANLTPEQATIAERLFIKEFNSIENGYNLTEGGEGSSGYKYTKEQKRNCSLAAIRRWRNEDERKKQSQRKKGSPGWHKGVKRTLGSRLKQSQNSAQANRIHCPKNHPLSGDNLYVHNGKRACKQCRRDACKRHYHAAKKVTN